MCKDVIETDLTSHVQFQSEHNKSLINQNLKQNHDYVTQSAPDQNETSIASTSINNSN